MHTLLNVGIGLMFCPVQPRLLACSVWLSQELRKPGQVNILFFQPSELNNIPETLSPGRNGNKFFLIWEKEIL